MEIPQHILNNKQFLKSISMQKLYQVIQGLDSSEGNLYQQLPMFQQGAQINHDISYTADIVELHSHTFYEILFICQGKNVQYLWNNNRYRLQKGDVMLIPPGVTHRPLFACELTEPYERYALWIEPDFFKSHAAQFPVLDYALEQCRLADSGLLRSTSATYSGLYAGFNTLWLEQEGRRFGWEAAVALGAVHLMIHISRTFYYRNASVAQTESRSLFDDVFQYIDTHLCEKLTLEYVAGQFHVSTSTISHLFRRQLDVSFYHCVIQRRLINAKNKILQGMSLQDVWEACGFTDYSSFYRLFKKEYGISPREFRTLNLRD
ncbi:AraC family transcriptional regulator [Eisenbergiella porci]|uniref:AraC family transcriptional regulator n=1 Tax=Eisenbergiella porci TaxID=2652274 RepID=UPI002A820145|nr:AraC family transcriptional regulator [Eisenbergiella porci]